MKLSRGLHLVWSFKRQIGYTLIVSHLARKYGIPTTSRGRQQKLGRWLGMK